MSETVWCHYDHDGNPNASSWRCRMGWHKWRVNIKSWTTTCARCEARTGTGDTIWML